MRWSVGTTGERVVYRFMGCSKFRARVKLLAIWSKAASAGEVRECLNVLFWGPRKKGVQETIENEDE